MHHFTTKLALIVSQFNAEVTQRLAAGAKERLAELNFPQQQLTYIEVPGAVEIPVIAKLLAEQGDYAAIVCLGAVIRGETSHYDYVCSQVSEGCQRVALAYGIPVIFGVLTTDTEEQALARAGGKHGHKGREAVDTALQMVDIVGRIKAKTLQRKVNDIQKIF